MGLGGVGMVAALAYANLARKRITSGKKIRSQDMDAVFKWIGVGGMPHARYPGLKNAFWASAGHKNSPMLKGLFTDEQRKAADKYGFVVYDPDLASEAVLSHEAGHASIGAGQQGSMHKVTQNVLRPLGSVLGLAGVIGSLQARDRLGAMHPATLGLAVGLPLVGQIPTLVSEYKASKTGLEGLDRWYEHAGVGDRAMRGRTVRNKQALKSAWGTYAGGAGLQAALGLFLLGVHGTYKY